MMKIRNEVSGLLAEHEQLDQEWRSCVQRCYQVHSAMRRLIRLPNASSWANKRYRRLSKRVDEILDEEAEIVKRQGQIEKMLFLRHFN